MICPQKKKFTCFHGDDHSSRGEGSCATTGDSSHSEGVGRSRSESTNSVCPTNHIHHSSSHTSPTILFLELHHVISDDPILINALYGIPGHHGSPVHGCCGIHHSARKSSGGYIQRGEISILTQSTWHKIQEKYLPERYLDSSPRTGSHGLRFATAWGGGYPPYRALHSTELKVTT